MKKRYAYLIWDSDLLGTFDDGRSEEKRLRKHAKKATKKARKTGKS